MQFRHKKGSHTHKKATTFESVVVDVENGRRESVKRSLQDYIYTAD